ncbi:MAG: FadR/GntR family transcriptional regulator [Lachnospiraceae bacterium]|nr:FadR/GntR family transcriptional regulator [Lachnospiraceae bacterium]
MPKALSELIADDIYAMITVEKRFNPGDKLPNENDFSNELNVNRATLREAIRILSTNGVLEIKRGKGTFVVENLTGGELDVMTFANKKGNIKDLYEMRIIIEPEAAYYATLRATENEIKNIIKLGNILEEKIVENVNRTKEEQEFHKAIAKATHNGYLNKLIPILLQAIYLSVVISQNNEELRIETLRDHRLVMQFMENRDADGARTAMRLHMIHACKLMQEAVDKKI